MLSVPEELQSSRRQSVHDRRRASLLYADDLIAPRARPPPRPKPPLDPVTLSARQQYAAHGLVEIMRRKVAKRRRVLREQTSVMSEAGDALDEQHSAAVDVQQADDDDINKPPQTMNNFYIISAIPYLPKTVAAVCLVLNVILPGSGTMLSGLSAFCCGKSRMHTRENKLLTVCCVNVMVGLMQFFTVTFLLVGWVWSLVWGIYMVILAEEHRKELKAAHDRELQAKALVAMNGQLRPWALTGHST